MFGHFSEETLELFIKMSCEDKDLDYSETFDFVRCQSPDGSFYGTRGMCQPPSKQVGPARGRNVLERNRQASENKAIEKAKANMLGNKTTMGKLSKPEEKTVHKPLDNGDRFKPKKANPFGSGPTKLLSNGSGSGGGGNKSGLSDAQLAAIFAKLGKGGKGRGR